MKLKLTYLLGAALVGLASCEPIDENDRFIQIDNIEAKRGVLLEDFTGQRCVNCPKAHNIINDLKKAYGEKIVAVSIHAGSFAIPSTKKSGLATEEGEIYATKWNIEAYPSGIVNRQSGVMSNMNQWTTSVINVIWQEPEIDITCEAKHNGNKIEIETELSSSKDVEGKLQLWLLESGIVAIQSLPDGSKDREYVHDHVFRSSINGTWGEDVSIGKNSTVKKTHTYEFDAEKFNGDNLSVVAFVYNDETGVLQVVDTHVK